jgi:hypothetical protein
MTRKIRLPIQPFQTGQVWELSDSNLHIGTVGKTLVHYKHYKGGLKRAPISLAAKTVLEKYLKQNKAVLVQA